MNEKIHFAGAVKIAFQKYFNFRGTASRSEYWYFVLFFALVSLVLGTFDMVFVHQSNTATDALAAALETNPSSVNMAMFMASINEDNMNSPISNLGSLLLMFPMATVFVRRMRDAGFSAWFLLLIWVPFFSFIMTVLPTKRRVV